jgi:hypothetical protein
MAGTILAPFVTDAPAMERRGFVNTLVLVVGTGLLAPRVVNAALGFCLVVMVGAAFLGTFLFCRGGSPMSSFWIVMLNWFWFVDLKSGAPAASFSPSLWSSWWRLPLVVTVKKGLCWVELSSS